MIPPGQALYIRKCRGKDSKGRLCPRLLIAPEKYADRLEFLTQCRWYLGEKKDAEYQHRITAVGGRQLITPRTYKLWFCPACGLKVARSVRYNIEPISQIIHKVRCGAMVIV